MARDRDNRKKATGQPKTSDAMDEGVVPDEPRDSDEDDPEKEDDEESAGEPEDTIMMNPAARVKVPRKTNATKTPARTSKADDRLICTAWYQTFLGVKSTAAEYLYDQEDLDKPSTWVKLNDKTISMIVKGCRDQSIHVSVSAVNKMGLLAFLCMHHERIQRPLLCLTV